MFFILTISFILIISVSCLVFDALKASKKYNEQKGNLTSKHVKVNANNNLETKLLNESKYSQPKVGSLNIKVIQDSWLADYFSDENIPEVTEELGNQSPIAEPKNVEVFEHKEVFNYLDLQNTKRKSSVSTKRKKLDPVPRFIRGDVQKARKKTDQETSKSAGSLSNIPYKFLSENYRMAYERTGKERFLNPLWVAYHKKKKSNK